jgi:hypothetical protein
MSQCDEERPITVSGGGECPRWSTQEWTPWWASALPSNGLNRAVCIVIHRWHAICSARVAADRVRVFQQKELVMLQTELYDHDVYGDPVPNVASDADIAVAERLRRELEERYLMRSPACPTLPERPADRSR